MKCKSKTLLKFFYTKGIKDNLLSLLTNNFASGVVIQVLKQNDLQINEAIFNVVSDNIINLSMNKYGSYVLEKCFDMAEKVNIYNV